MFNRIALFYTISLPLEYRLLLFFTNTTITFIILIITSNFHWTLAILQFQSSQQMNAIATIINATLQIRKLRLQGLSNLSKVT